MSNVAAAAFAPFISAASPKLFGFDECTELSKPRDLEKIFDSLEYAKWRAFRDSEDSRFVTLTMPRALARLPYGEKTKPDRGVRLRGGRRRRARRSQVAGSRPVLLDERRLRHGRADDRCLRASTASARRSAAPKAAARSKGCRPTPSSATTATWIIKCPTEIAITDRRENELSQARLPAAVPLQEHRLRRVLRGADRRRSRRSTTGPRRPPTPRFRRGCPTSWRPRVSPTI